MPNQNTSTWCKKLNTNTACLIKVQRRHTTSPQKVAFWKEHPRAISGKSRDWWNMIPFRQPHQLVPHVLSSMSKNIPCWASTHMDPPIDTAAGCCVDSQWWNNGFEGFGTREKPPLLFFFWGGAGESEDIFVPAQESAKWTIMDQSLEVGLCSSWIYLWSLFWRCENNSFTNFKAQKSAKKTPTSWMWLGFFSVRFFFVAWNRCFLEDPHFIGVKMRKCFGRHHFFLLLLRMLWCRVNFSFASWL